MSCGNARIGSTRRRNFGCGSNRCGPGTFWDGLWGRHGRGIHVPFVAAPVRHQACPHHALLHALLVAEAAAISAASVTTFE
jgi:hypothetical protein